MEALPNFGSAAERLKQVRVFRELDDAALLLVSSRMTFVTVRPGETVCREGEIGDRMFLIAEGEVDVLKQGEGGGNVQIAVLHPGDIAGEMSLFGPVERSATLRARTECGLWVLDYGTFQSLVDEHVAFGKALVTYLSRRLRRETSVVARLISSHAAGGFPIAFFDSQPYMEAIFRERNRYQYGLQFLEPRLSPETVSLAAGFRAVCLFVNDCLNALVAEELHALGVELVALRCAGFNQVDLAACEKHSLSVVRVPAYSPYAVAEHAVALMLALNRRIHRAYYRVREGNFSLAGLMGFDMHGKTAGIIGTGKIGKCVAQILGGFGCELVAHDQYPDPGWAAGLGVRYVDLDTLYATADIITLHAPLTPQTYHLINAAALPKMKRGVMLINTSRGALIDTPALLQGLKSGQIGYAGLDVYEEESEYFFRDRSDQVITDDVLARLMTFNNVMITGHQAFLTHEALAKIAEVTFENVREFESGKRLKELTHWVGRTG